MTKRWISLLMAIYLLTGVIPVSAEAPVNLDTLMQEIDALGEDNKALNVGPVTFEISRDRQSIYLNKPVVNGSSDYTIAYNIYDSDSNPINYFYSLENRVAATPGYGGLFNVFVVVTDRATGAQNTQNIGWQTLAWPYADKLSVGKATFEISPDGRSIFVDRPDIKCKSGDVTIAYNIYDAQGQPVNYFYSAQRRVAATPGYTGRFNVFVVVTDPVAMEQDVQNIGWNYLVDPNGNQPIEEIINIIQQPADQSASIGELVQVTVEATGVQTYQWQYSYDNGETWKNCSTGGHNTKTYSFTVIANHYSRLLRCKLIQKNGEYVYTDVVHLFRNEWPAIIDGIHYDRAGNDVVVIGVDEGQSALNITNEVLGLPVTSIGDYAFENRTKINKKVVIPVTVRSIGKGAFKGCSGIPAITLSEGITNIAFETFKGCTRLNDISLPDGLIEIGRSAFLGCSSLSEITIPESVTSIGKYAFESCSNLKKIKIPDGVTVIENGAFKACEQLTAIDIPIKVTKISNEAFRSCTNLKSFSVPQNVTSIGKNAFEGCTALAEITILANVTSIDVNAFQNCPHLTIYGNRGSVAETYANEYGIPFEALDAPEPMIFNGIHFEEVNGELIVTDLDDDVSTALIPGILAGMPVTAINEHAFFNKMNLQKAYIPDSVRSIGYGAFSGCQNLMSVNQAVGSENPASLRIEGCAFQNCKSLQNVVIPASTTYIGERAFWHCESFTSITIPNSTTYIGSKAFAYCFNLESFEIGAGVNSIGENAFEWCPKLAIVTILNRNTSIGANAFMDCDNLTLRGYSGSTTESYAGMYGIPFVSIDNPQPQPPFTLDDVENHPDLAEARAYYTVQSDVFLDEYILLPGTWSGGDVRVTFSLRNKPQPDWDLSIILGTFWDENIHPFTYSRPLDYSLRSDGRVDVIIPDEWMRILFRDGRLWFGAFADYLYW